MIHSLLPINRPFAITVELIRWHDIWIRCCVLLRITPIHCFAIAHSLWSPFSRLGNSLSSNNPDSLSLAHSLPRACWSDMETQFLVTSLLLDRVWSFQNLSRRPFWERFLKAVFTKGWKTSLHCPSEEGLKSGAYLLTPFTWNLTMLTPIYR